MKLVQTDTERAQMVVETMKRFDVSASEAARWLVTGSVRWNQFSSKRERAQVAEYVACYQAQQ